MDSVEFSRFRKRLERTQKEVGRLLGVSLGAVHSYEQGWREVPPHVERQMLFLLSRRQDIEAEEACWDVKDCPRERREECPAWQFHFGQLCWFVNGTICEGRIQKDWQAKMQVCRKCEVLRRVLKTRG